MHIFLNLASARCHKGLRHPLGQSVTKTRNLAIRFAGYFPLVVDLIQSGFTSIVGDPQIRLALLYVPTWLLLSHSYGPRGSTAEYNLHDFLIKSSNLGGPVVQSRRQPKPKLTDFACGPSIPLVHTLTWVPPIWDSP
jgi:hypothetical protein